jgi:hypothetical protein
MRAQVNKFKTKYVVEKEKEKTKANFAEKTKRQTIANHANSPQQMT